VALLSFYPFTQHLLVVLKEFRSLGIQSSGNIDTSSPLEQALFTIVSAVAQLGPI